MVEQVRAFLDQDWTQISKEFHDFTDFKQSELKKAMETCSKDFEYPLEKPYDTEQENFKYFALCLRNEVYLNPVLNASKGVRSSILGW